jgi:CRP-like cAMP-binding protein
LDNDQRLNLADECTIKRFQRGEHIIEIGKKADAFFILLNGKRNQTFPFLSNRKK